MVRTVSRWLTLALALGSLVAAASCSGGGNPAGVPNTPQEPFVPNPPSGGGAISAPQNVTAIPSNRQITVSFDRVSGATGYNVYISTDGTTFLRFNNSTPYGTTTIVLTGLVNGKTYYIGVSAVFPSGESNTSYAGGSPSADPLVPGGIVTPPTQAKDIVETPTVWTTANVSSAIPPPDDRRMLVSWKSKKDPNVVGFLVTWMVAAHDVNDNLVLPEFGNSSVPPLIFYRHNLTISPGGHASLTDPDYGPYDDPSMAFIRQTDVPSGSQDRTEAVLEVPYDASLMVQLINDDGLTASQLLSELTSNFYRYTEAQLGIQRDASHGLIVDQNVLDGVNRLGLAVQVTAVFADGSMSKPATGFGYIRDSAPEEVKAADCGGTDPEIVSVPNPSWDPKKDISPPVLGQLTWHRLRFPMGSDIVDYTIGRNGKVGDSLTSLIDIGVVYQLSANGPTAVFDPSLVRQPQLRTLLAFKDDKDPAVVNGQLYSYSIIPLDRSGQFGPRSERGSLHFRNGPKINLPPVVVGSINQGGVNIPLDGSGQIKTGPSAAEVDFDFTGTVDPNGGTITSIAGQFAGEPAGTIQIDPTSLVGSHPALQTCAQQPTVLTFIVTESEGLSTTITINLHLVKGSDCT